MGKRIGIVLLACILLLTTGCWDRKDIEERSYVSGVAFDKPEEAVVEEQRENLEKPELYTPRYIITYISPIPNAQVGDAGGEPFTTRSITAVSPKEAERQIMNRTALDLFFGHTKLVLFGEEILEDPKDVKKMVDYLHRNQEFNWNVLVAVVQGSAKDAFAIKPTQAPHLVNYIAGIMDNKRETNRVAKVNLNQMMSDLVDDGAMALPKLIVAEDEVKVEGAALIKDYKFAGYFSGIEGRSLMFLKGTIEGGGIVTSYKDAIIPYTIVNAGVKKELNVTEEGLQMIFTIETEGQLEEGTYGLKLFDDKNIKEIESKVEEELVEDCEKVIEKIQKEYKVDIIYVASYIQKFHPKLWKEVEGDWEEVFSEMDFKVKAQVNIRRTGVIR